MVQTSCFLVRVVSAFLVAMATCPGARASFIVAPMPASLASGPSYQPLAPTGKPAPELPLSTAPDIAGGLLQPELITLGSSSLVVQDAGPKTVLPEPATIAILGIGLVSLAFLRRAVG